MRVGVICLMVLALVGVARAQSAFQLVSSSPAAGAANVPVGTPIVLMFNEYLNQTSTITVRGTRQNVMGAIFVDSGAGTITLTPFTALDPGETYTVDFSNVRDLRGDPPLPPRTFQFSTEGGARVVVTSLPQSAQAGAGQRVSLSYMLRNLSSVGATITGSRTIYLLTNGNQIMNVNQPMRQTLLANASATIASEVSIEPAMVAAARSVSADRLLIVRVFQGTDANNNPLRSLTDTAQFANFPGDRSLFGQGLVAITTVRLLDSITAGSVVREITVTAPTGSLSVVQGGQVHGRALITASGNGIVIGRWMLDGAPFESFQTSVQAGTPSTINTVRSLPTTELGERRLQLQILSPNPMLSRESRFTVSPPNQSFRTQLVGPAFGQLLDLRSKSPIVLRWQVVPGASGYEVGIASKLASLGLTAQGKPARGFDQKALLVSRRVSGASQTSYTLSGKDLELLGADTSEDLYWTVQPLFPPSQEPMSDRAAFPGHLRVARNAAPLQLLAPLGEGTVRGEGFEFTWVQPTASVSEYRVQVFAEGDEGSPIFQALTHAPRFVYSPVGGVALAAGRRLRWRVLGLGEQGRVVAMGPSAPLRLEAAAPAPMFAPVHAAFSRALSGATFTPALGATVSGGRVEIVASYPAGDHHRRRLLLDGTDVTALAEFGPSEARLSARSMAPGLHTVQLVVEGADGEPLESRSWFTLQSEEPLAPDPHAVANGLRLLLQSEVQSNDPFHVVAILEGGGAFGTADGSVNVTASRSLGGGDFEVRTLLGNVNDPGRGYGLAIGDVGMQGSEFTVDGASTRAFQANMNTGGLAINFTKTLDDVAGRSNFGNSPDITMGSIETGRFNEGTGLRFVTLRSEQDSNGVGSTGFGPPSGLEADIWSLLGKYKIGDTLSLRGEMARSRNSYLTLGSTRMRSSGDAKTLALDYKGVQGWNATARYRRTDTGYLAPSAALMQNNVQGWDVQTSGPLGPNALLSVRYGLAENVASDSVPHGSTNTLSANLDLRVQEMPVQLSYQQTVASGDSLVLGLPGASTRDTQWTLGTSRQFGPVDASISYSLARFLDFEDFNDPSNDIPNDRTTRFLSLGLGAKAGRLTMRGDWSDNGVSRYDRDPLTFALLDGRDRQDNVRLQADYALASAFSASAIWSRARNSDLLGLAIGDSDDIAFRINWLPFGTVAAQSVVTVEFRQSRFLSGGARRTENTFTLLVNGAGIFKR